MPHLSRVCLFSIRVGLFSSFYLCALPFPCQRLGAIASCLAESAGSTTYGARVKTRGAHRVRIDQENKQGRAGVSSVQLNQFNSHWGSTSHRITGENPPG